MTSMTMMTETVAEPQTTTSTETLPPHHVVLFNDDDHNVDYVIRMLKDLFGHSREKGAEMAKEFHTSGRVIVTTTNLEEAELKRERIHDYGPDPMILHCKGSMSAEVEPASS